MGRKPCGTDWICDNCEVVCHTSSEGYFFPDSFTEITINVTRGISESIVFHMCDKCWPIEHQPLIKRRFLDRIKQRICR